MVQLCFLVAAGMPLLLGCIHLVYTFFTTKLDPRDASVRAAMSGTSMRITRDTTVWRAWVGFNASHSLGLASFGAVYTFLALSEPTLLRTSLLLKLVGAATLLAYVVLARVYWFKVPLAGISLAAVAFIVGCALT